MKLISKLHELLSKDVSRFLCANILFSLSSWLIGFLAPYIMQSDTYQDFIYVYQNILYLTSAFTLGLVPALLRYYKQNPNRYYTYFHFLTAVIFTILLMLGLWMDNPVSNFLNLQFQDRLTHFLVYLSVVFTLLFVFNRALLTAKEDYNKLIKTVLLIFLLRVCALVVIYSMNVENIIFILCLICVLPMFYEFVVYFLSVSRCEKVDYKHLWNFVRFAVTTSVIGLIYMTTNRLYLLEAKVYSDKLAAIISYSYGMIGIINIFSTTFTTYYIGKLDHRDRLSIIEYVSRLRKYFPSFVLLSIVISIFTYFIIKIIYPYDGVLAGTYTAISLFFTSLMLYIGMFNLLTKTFNLLNKQLILNIASLVIIAVIVRYMCNFSNISSFILVNVIQLIFELLVGFIVLRHLKIKIQ